MGLRGPSPTYQEPNMNNYEVWNGVQLQRACDMVMPGDQILVHGGDYTESILLEEVRGTKTKPIRIVAADSQWITGRKDPDPHRKIGIPIFGAPAFLRLDRCKHVIIEGLRIKHWWPTIVHATASSRLTIRGCQMRHATYAIVASDIGRPTCHNLLIEGNHWQQDDSEEHSLWFRIDWQESHGEEETPGSHQYFNGGFFGSHGIRGQVIIRNNLIEDAFNGIRMKSGKKPPTARSAGKVNSDVYIFENRFIRIRDNPIEPEVYAYNWHVRHNALLDCHAWFSLDHVAGGRWFFYGNSGWFESRQGSLDDHAKGEHTMGRVLKLSYEMNAADPGPGRVPTEPWFVFNNSWHLRCPVIGGANADVATAPPGKPGPDFTAKLAFFNNAFAWCLSSLDEKWLCEPIELIRHFDLQHSSAIVFDHDICNRADFMHFFQNMGSGEHHGIVTTAPLFTLPIDGGFALTANSPARASGWVNPESKLPGMFAMRLQADATLNRGAVQDYGLTQVPELEREAADLLKTMAT